MIGWCSVVVVVNSRMRVDARSCMKVFGTRKSKYYRCSRCGTSDVACRTVPPIGGLSCFISRVSLNVSKVQVVKKNVTDVL